MRIELPYLECRPENFSMVEKESVALSQRGSRLPFMSGVGRAIAVVTFNMFRGAE
jgi:hypothetical protein